MRIRRALRFGLLLAVVVAGCASPAPTATERRTDSPPHLLLLRRRTPDVPIPASSADYFGGIDPVLEAALRD